MAGRYVLKKMLPKMHNAAQAEYNRQRRWPVTEAIKSPGQSDLHNIY
jgi:hypothetical protein